MTLQLAGKGVLPGVAGLCAPDCGGERVVIHDKGGSGPECCDRCDLDGDIADGVCFEIFIDDLGVIRFFRTDDRVDCDTLLDV